MTPNLLHAVRPREVTVTLLGQRWRLSGHSAVDWIGGIGWDVDGLLGIMPGMVAGEQVEQLLDLSWEHADIDTRLLCAAQAAIGKAAGRDWIWAYNLSLKCLHGWQYFNGVMLRHGVRAEEVSYPDWLDAVYMLLWERSDESDRKALDFELMLPPKNMHAVPSAASSRKMLEAFAAD